MYVLQYSNFSLFKEASGQLTLITLPSTIFIAVQSYFSLHVFRNVFVYVTYTITAHFYHQIIFFLRSIRFEYDQETTVDGALGYRYKLGHKLISNKTDCESNECFNPQPSDIQVEVNLKQKMYYL